MSNGGGNSNSSRNENRINSGTGTIRSGSQKSKMSSNLDAINNNSRGTPISVASAEWTALDPRTMLRERLLLLRERSLKHCRESTGGGDSRRLMPEVVGLAWALVMGTERLVRMILARRRRFGLRICLGISLEVSVEEEGEEVWAATVEAVAHSNPVPTPALNLDLDLDLDLIRAVPMVSVAKGVAGEEAIATPTRRLMAPAETAVPSGRATSPHQVTMEVDGMVTVPRSGKRHALDGEGRG